MKGALFCIILLKLYESENIRAKKGGKTACFSQGKGVFVRPHEKERGVNSQNVATAV